MSLFVGSEVLFGLTFRVVGTAECICNGQRRARSFGSVAQTSGEKRRLRTHGSDINYASRIDRAPQRIPAFQAAHAPAGLLTRCPQTLRIVAANAFPYPPPQLTSPAGPADHSLRPTTRRAYLPTQQVRHNYPSRFPPPPRVIATRTHR